jgi:hypothetical protein
MKFKVTANSAGSVGLTQVNFQVSTSTSPAVNLLNVILYAYTDSSYSSPVSSLTNGQFGSTLCQSAGACSPKLVFTQNPPLQVGAGQTVYFKLYASVTGGSASGAGITTVLLGDSVYSGINTAAYVASSTNNFIWAGNKTTTSAVGDVDWSNGFGLSGFPASGLVQTRSN